MPSQRALARARRQRRAAAALTEPSTPEPSSGSDDASVEESLRLERVLLLRASCSVPPPRGHPRRPPLPPPLKDLSCTEQEVVLSCKDLCDDVDTVE